MAATNYTPIQLYYSTTASAVPLAANLAQGELAINIADGKLYYEDSTGVVQVIATKGAGTIGGSTTQIQFNDAGALAGNAAMVFDKATNITTLTTLNLTNALGATYGGTAQSSYTQGDLLYSSATNTLSKLGIGTVDYILTSTGSVPQWSAPSSISVLTATNLAGGAAGSVPYQSAASTTTFLAIGSTSTVMTSSGTAPQWSSSLTGLLSVSSSGITNTSLTSGRLVYSTTGGAQTDDADLTFNGTTLSAGGYSTTGLTTLVKTVTIGNSNFSGVAVFEPNTPAKLYLGNGTVTDATSAIGATNAAGAIASLAVTPIAATNANVTYTNASTLYIAGAPSAGTNVTITNPYSLYIAAGASYFGGALSLATALSTANGGTGLSSYTAGDLSYYASGTSLTKLAIGTAGQILTSSGTAPQWTTLSGVTVTTFSAGTTGFTPATATSGAVTLAGTLNVANGGTGLTTLAPGSLTFGSGTSAFATLAVGTAGQVLTSSGIAPQWSTLSGVAVTTLSFGTTGLTPSSATSGAITVAGTLAPTNGGTGLTSFTANRVFYASSSSAIGSSANLTFDGTTLNALTITENSSPVVVQSDIGTAANEIPLNQYLGSMAYQDGTNYFNTGMTVGYRNRLFNGAMQIDQRNAGASVTLSSGDTYTLDRWQFTMTQASKLSTQQSSTVPANFTSSMLATSLSAYSVTSSDCFAVRQIIEGYNISDLGFGTSSAKSITVSFWTRSSLTGIFGASIQSSDQNRGYAFTYTINTANTWEYKTVVIPGDTTGTWLTTNGKGLYLTFGLGCGSSFSATAGAWLSQAYINSATGGTSLVGTSGATWYVTGVQVEVGTQATPFDWRPYTTELALCQRYYVNVVSGGASIAVGFMWNTSELGSIVSVPVTMRSSPALVQTTGTAYYAFERAAGNQTFSSFTNIARWAGQQGYLYTSSSGTTGDVGELRGNNVASYIAFSSEL